MKNYIIASFLCFFYLVPSSGVYGQDPYYWKLTDEDGLPSLTVYQVLQDHNGLIWIATANGLCSFDGKFIHNYDCSSLNDLEILKIQEAPDGKIWGLNLSGQLFRADNFEVEVVSSLGNVNLNKVIDFTISGEYLIFGQVNSFTLNSLIRKFNFYRQESSDDTISVKGLLYAIVETNKRIVLYSGIKNDAYLTFLPDCRTFANNYQNCYYNCSSKHLYFKGDTILLPKDNQSIDLIDFSSGIKKGQLRLERNTKSILYVDNYFYFALNQGVVQSDLKHSFSFLPDKTINNVIRDVEGNFFFSTSEGVLIISDFKQVNRRECSSIISSNKVHVLFNDGNRGVIYGTPSGNLSKVVGNQIRSFRETYSSKITSILLPIKKYLIGTDEGLFYLNNKNALIKTAIKCLYLDSEKLVFFGASHAFGWLNPITNKVKVIENLRTYAISETNDGLIWVGSDKGIYTYDRKNFLPYIDNISNSQFPCRVTDMKTSSDGRLWISTLNHGVISVKDKKIEKIYDKSTSLKTNVVHCVAIDSNFVWFGTDRGVYRCNLQTSEVFNINKYFGLPSDEIISLCSSKNVLLIGTSKGLISMPFEAMKLNRVPPNLHLLGIKVNELEQKTSESTFDLNYRQNNLLIEFVSYQYRAKGDARYEYRIKELDTTWTLTDQRFLRFPNLSPGNYHVEIRAVNECDVRSDKNISLYFKIAKPFWLQWWFILGLLSIIGAVIWMIAYLKFKQLQKEREVELSYKSRIEDLRNQALQAQMNPHFIFNSLNAVQHYLSLNDNSKAIKFLSKFAALIRIVFEFSKKKEISLASELEMMDLYLSLEQLRFARSIEIDFIVEDEVRQKQEQILLPPLLIQPMIENSFRHGLFHKLEGGKLIIKFEVVYDFHVKCTIEDNGIGRTKTLEMASWKPKQYTSTGLYNTEERIKYWHEKNKTNITDFFKIEDLFIGNKPSGTKVTLIL